MKKRLNKKFNLKKTTVSHLNDLVLANIKGGTGNTGNCLPTEDPTQVDCGKPILW
ncbi:MAG: hypothetical protein GY757_32265 [bacterium]|nr:hypothetical protein [bacterium]